MFGVLFCFAVVGFVVSSPTPAKDDTRIVGGHDIEIMDAPYQVSLLNRGRHTCGGAIIANDLIVTAAHCIMGTQPTNYQVRVGSSFSHTGGELYPVGDFVWHEGFTYSRMDNDVALLWLSKPINFKTTAAPIELFDENEEIADGDMTIVTGWGHLKEGGRPPAVLQMVEVPVVNGEACLKAYAPAYSITPRMLCAGVPEGGKDACQGDSGGPLVFNNKLAGVVSWGLGCARPEYPGVYAKVSALRTWLDQNIELLRMKHVLRAIN